MLLAITGFETDVGLIRRGGRGAAAVATGSLDLGLLADPSVVVWGLVVIAVASVGKFAGAFIGGTVARLPRLESLALGAGLNARGALEIVIAAVGCRSACSTRRATR